MARSKHGSPVRGMDSVAHSSVRDQRFGRMFRNLPAAAFTEDALTDLAKTMFQGEFAEKIEEGKPVDVALNEREPEDENPTIPAGFTYFGQFLDHDITFDPVSSLDRFNDPDALQDFRTPRLDLDSVYGSGPADQPFLYEDDELHLLLGDDKDFDGTRRNRPDLPRNTAPIRRALLGDKRNDENLIVSQLHATFLRFHNKVVDTLRSRDFEHCQQTVRWHYQWIVLHDFLPRILGKETYERVIVGRGEKPNIRFYNPQGRYAFIPVEFSVAAYRYGHSMVRPSYSLNRIVTKPDPIEQPFRGKMAKFHRIPIFSLTDVVEHPLANLNGFRELPGFWPIDWAFFFDGVAPDGEPPAGAVLPQPSYKLDTTLVDPLTSLPDHQHEPIKIRRALAALNLLRGWRLGLPSGQAVARHMEMEALSDEQLFDSEDADRKRARAAVLNDHPASFKENAPLWFYVLREAEIFGNSQHLGPVGGTIIAEVLAGLIREDRHSFLAQWPKWRPTLPGAVAGHFTMADLINFTNG
ncbi:heme peroxidase family protein [Rhizobium sp. Pop5]|uniref:peroxidase family protein n=1 Tax=Rhizobium sp. Pop5 TaxID=1223565 RepID=UPI001FD8D445|nr:heme peroxidase family protein [Rhizobium sp. Pop5]UVD58962.1 heme peroxidase family protein [Rhizobium sp. Pop5]